MSLNYFINKKYIPCDGSLEIIKSFAANTDSDVLVFPDVHYKKGCSIANGMLISSIDKIYPSCLGVENCGYSFGTINCDNENTLVNSFRNLSQNITDLDRMHTYTSAFVVNTLKKHLVNNYNLYPESYQYINIFSVDELISFTELLLDDILIEKARKSLCCLGGGNHFFEIHKIEKIYEDGQFKPNQYIFMLHTDSIAVGGYLYELFSDLHEMKNNKSLLNWLRIERFKFYQKSYFKKISEKIPGICKDLDMMLCPQNKYQSICTTSPLGSLIILSHKIAACFGEMNREEIIKMWADKNISYSMLASHSHDSVTIEKHLGKMRTVHRNGVQYIGRDPYCILPSAMGNYSYIMRNAFNEHLYFSANHGTGRIKDKHIARAHFKSEATEAELKNKNVELFKIGKCNLAEQNMHAFKEPSVIAEEMERYKIANKVAMTVPIAVIKG